MIVFTLSGNRDRRRHKRRRVGRPSNLYALKPVVIVQPSMNDEWHCPIEGCTCVLTPDAWTESRIIHTREGIMYLSGRRKKCESCGLSWNSFDPSLYRSMPRSDYCSIHDHISIQDKLVLEKSIADDLGRLLASGTPPATLVQQIQCTRTTQYLNRRKFYCLHKRDG